MSERGTRGLADRIGTQNAVAIPAAEATVGQGTSGPNFPGVVFVGDIENVRCEVVNETATPLTVCKVQGTSGPADGPDANWIDAPGGSLLPIGANGTGSVVLQNQGWRFVRLRATDGAGLATATIAWSGQ